MSIRNTLEAAVAAHQVVRIVYTSRHRGFPDTTSREIEPLRVSGGMVAAYCRLREELRHFRFDRIHSARLTGETFTVRPEFLDIYDDFSDDVSPYAGSSAYRQGEGRPSVRGDGEVEVRRKQGLGVGCWVMIAMALLFLVFGILF